MTCHKIKNQLSFAIITIAFHKSTEQLQAVTFGNI